MSMQPSLCRMLRISRRAMQVARMSTSIPRPAFKEFTMPAMSPTMEHGNLGQWKVSEGDAFSAGDVILEVETDKAMMDVEAQDDGVMARIVVPSGSKDVPVNDLIAWLADEGDDLSKVPDAKDDPHAPKDAAKDAPKEAPTEAPKEASHSTDTVHVTKPTFPSVLRLAHERGISEPENVIKGTGRHGMITKGDVLAYLGDIKSAFGTAQVHHTTMSEMSGARSDGAHAKASRPVYTPLSALEHRQLVVKGLASLALPKRTPPSPVTYADVLQGYGTPKAPAPPRPSTAASALAAFYEKL